MNEIDWYKNAASILKSELTRRNISYKELASLLNVKTNTNETEASIRSKLSRGTFKFSFFLQCAYVIKLDNFRLDNLIIKKESK